MYAMIPIHYFTSARPGRTLAGVPGVPRVGHLLIDMRLSSTFHATRRMAVPSSVAREIAQFTKVAGNQNGVEIVIRPAR